MAKSEPLAHKRVGGGRIVAAVAVVATIAGAAWYVVQLRSENVRLRAAMAPPIPGGRTLSPEQRRAMLDKLGGSAAAHYPIWFATSTNNSEAAAFQRVIEEVFVAAGWESHGNTPVSFPLKPGIFMFSADEYPPPYVQSVLDAFDAAHLTVTFGRGYRNFYAEKKKEDANWIGFAMQPDQSFIVAIGRKPDE